MSYDLIAFYDAVISGLLNSLTDTFACNKLDLSLWLGR